MELEKINVSNFVLMYRREKLSQLHRYICIRCSTFFLNITVWKWINNRNHDLNYIVSSTHEDREILGDITPDFNSFVSNSTCYSQINYFYSMQIFLQCTRIILVTHNTILYVLSKVVHFARKLQFSHIAIVFLCVLALWNNLSKAEVAARAK